jgi:hypothetical protein
MNGVRRNYPELHLPSLTSESNPLYMGHALGLLIASYNIYPKYHEKPPVVTFEIPRKNNYGYQLPVSVWGVQPTVRNERIGRIENIKSLTS